MRPDAALNVATTLRSGARLTTVEVISIIYDVCRQLDAGTARTLPGYPDDLWLTEAGTVVIDAPESRLSPRAAVASLLDTLLPLPGRDPAYDVPAALRTLPDRLRASGNSTSNDYKDLIAILQRYLPAEPKELLEQFVRRNTTSPADDELGGLIAETAPEAAPVAVAAPAARRGKRRSRLLPAAAVLALAASAYAGYRVSRTTEERDSRDTVAAAADAPPTAPRIVAAPTRRANAAFNTGHLVTQPLLLDAPQGAFSPSFGVDNTIVFHIGRMESGRIVATTLDDRARPSGTVPLFEDEARNYHARLSPDGSQLAFDSDRDGERGVYISQRDGANPRRVSGEGYAAVPSWSPDGSRLTFIKAEAAGSRVWNLWMLEITPGRIQRLSSFRTGQVWGASWFSNGREIAYSHEDRLFIADVAAGTRKEYRSPVRGRLVRTPAVSPDGRWIIFQVYRDGVWVLNVTTGEMQRVLDDPTAEEFAWDSLGRRIAYHSRRDGQWRIWLMDTSAPGR